MTGRDAGSQPPDQPQLLVLSGKTLTHEGHAYPLANISYFGPGVRPRTPIPWTGVLLMFLAALGLEAMDHSVIATLAGLTACGLAFYNIAKRNQPGLVIEMNSGRTVFFGTSDRNGVEQVTDLISGILARLDSEIGTTKVSITESSVRFCADTNITGNVNQGIVNQGMTFTDGSHG